MPSPNDVQPDKSLTRGLAGGSAALFAAEALILPTGLVTASVLTRTLGPTDYGTFTLASQLVAWVCWSMAAMLARPSIKLVADHVDWQPVASTVVRVFAGGGLAAAALLLFGAPLARAALGAPEIELYLRLFSLEVLLFTLAQGHGTVLIARGAFYQRAVASAARLLTRMTVMVALVLGGLSVTGAVLGSISAVAADFAVCRYYVRPRLFTASTFPGSHLLRYGAPLFVFALCVRLFERLDLFAVSSLSIDRAAVGVFAAAQNLSVIPVMLTLSFAPIVLSTLSQLTRDGRTEEADALAHYALRLSVCMLAFLGVAIGCAEEVVISLFGGKFTGAGLLLSFLITAQAAMVVQSVCVAVLLVAERRHAISALGAIMLLAAALGHFWAIPRWGSTGAAVVTFSVAGLGTVAAAVLANFASRLRVPVATVVRTTMVGLSVYLCANAWSPTQAGLIAIKVAVLTAFVPFGLVLLGELGARERRALAGLVQPLLALSDTLRRGER